MEYASQTATQTPAQQETFLQRQKRLAGQQSAVSTQTAAPTSIAKPMALQPTQQPLQSPVTSTGRVPQPYTPSVPAAAAQSTGPLQAPSLGTQPYQPYQFQTQVPQAPTLPGSYGGTQFSQFAAPQQQQATSQQNNLLSAILTNPQTMNPAAVAAMQEAGKEQAVLLGQQAQQGLAANAAMRGVSGGGWAAGQQRAIDSDVGNQILSGNRAVSLEALARNRQDELNALGAADSVMSGQMGRATEGYRTGLLGQQTQAEDDRGVANDAIQRAILGHTASLDSARLGLTAEQSQADEYNRGYTNDMQRALAQFGINSDVFGSNLDAAKFDEMKREFEKTYGMDFAKFLESQRQFNADTGYRYASLNQQGNRDQYNLVQSILGGLR
jgi:hypothetical protein